MKNLLRLNNHRGYALLSIFFLFLGFSSTSYGALKEGQSCDEIDQIYKSETYLRAEPQLIYAPISYETAFYRGKDPEPISYDLETKLEVSEFKCKRVRGLVDGKWGSSTRLVLHDKYISTGNKTVYIDFRFLDTLPLAGERDEVELLVRYVFPEQILVVQDPRSAGPHIKSEDLTHAVLKKGGKGRGDLSNSHFFAVRRAKDWGANYDSFNVRARLERKQSNLGKNASVVRVKEYESNLKNRARSMSLNVSSPLVKSNQGKDLGRPVLHLKFTTANGRVVRPIGSVGGVQTHQLQFNKHGHAQVPVSFNPKATNVTYSISFKNSPYFTNTASTEKSVVLEPYVKPAPVQHAKCRKGAATDPDGDGYGYEKGKTCLVYGHPICDKGAASDPDGDGFGWENNATCVVINKSTPNPNPHPYCVRGSNSDPDGDGYGWENNATCIVKDSKADKARSSRRPNQREKNSPPRRR